MGRAPCCQKVGLKRGRWTSQEDETLIKYIQAHGEGSWKSLPKNAGLLRCGKSCRLRWINYLRGDLKRGNFTNEEEEMIVKLHTTFGNRWSMIASHLPGRTDNEIKNHWNSHLSRQIYRFITNKNDKTQTSIDIATLVNQKKPRVGRVSRCVAKKYNKNRVFKNSKSTPQITTKKSAPPTSLDNQIDHQNVGDCSISVTKSIEENLVCDINDINEEFGWNELGLQDDELIDINYFLESEAMDSTKQVEIIENMKNNNEWNVDEREDQNLQRFNYSETKGFGFDEIKWDMGFGIDEIEMCDEGDDMLVWLWESGNP